MAVALACAVVRREALLAAALGAGLVAGAAAPAVASATLVLRDQGSFDTPFEAARQAGRDPRRCSWWSRPRSGSTIPKLQQARFGAPYLLAAQSAALASVFIYDTGLEALPIGGFTGTIPSPTLGQLQADIRQGKFHLVLAGHDPRPAAGLDRRALQAAGRRLGAAASTSACQPSGAERIPRPSRP